MLEGRGEGAEMKVPEETDPLAWDEVRYIQPIMTSATKWSNQPSFIMTLDGTCTGGAVPYLAFDGKGSLSDNRGWGGYGGGKATPPILSFYLLMTFEQPLKVVGVRFFSGVNARPRYYDFYGVEDDGTEVPLWHRERWSGNFADNMRCENPRYFRRYKFTQSFNEGWDGWARVFRVELDAYYRPSDLHS